MLLVPLIADETLGQPMWPCRTLMKVGNIEKLQKEIKI
jgi:hypothetical protein